MIFWTKKSQVVRRWQTVDSDWDVVENSSASVPDTWSSNRERPSTAGLPAKATNVRNVRDGTDVRDRRKERKNRKLQPIGTELSSFLLNSSFFYA